MEQYRKPRVQMRGETPLCMRYPTMRSELMIFTRVYAINPIDGRGHEFSYEKSHLSAWSLFPVPREVTRPRADGVVLVKTLYAL